VLTVRLSVVVFALVVGCGGGGGGHATDGPHGDGKATGDSPASANVFDVQFTTSKGVFVVEAHHDWAPNGVDRFHDLVAAGFYDQTRFFRIVPGFVVQWGINGTPATNAMWSGRTIQDDPVMKSNTRGYVSFAATNAPNSRTTQLFVNYGNNANLDALGFAPIGVVTTGMSVVDSFDSEYGQQPDQSQISSQGNAYLMANFPNLDYIMTARIM
jgi:cyclophilin family peptidyl-prolyl cis-trans isomerase